MKAANSPTNFPVRTVRRSCWRASGTAEYKGDRRIAFSIVTEEPNELVGPYHDRMLLALADDKVSEWLDLANTTPFDGSALLDLGAFAARAMDRAMNNARQKDLAVTERVSA
jgi:putative SOS response-associated peptidase YedK